MESKEKETKDIFSLWLKQFKLNYEGKSEEAKEVVDFVKATYNGASYIPWATMERLTYMQDPRAEFGTIANKTDGGVIWTDSFVNRNKVANKEGVVNESEALVVSHFVKVYCVFLGKTFVEEYPIQEQDYSPAKIYNQNLVNKAIKRAMAKVASRATGIGLKLYEAKDLQFDDTVEDTSKTVNTSKKAKKTTKVEEVIKTEEVVEEKVEKETNNEKSYSKEVIELCRLIKDTPTDKIQNVLQTLNVAILKQHNFTLSQEDSDEELCKKLSTFNDVNVFTKAITNMLN